jgi:hypothetical protein
MRLSDTRLGWQWPFNKNWGCEMSNMSMEMSWCAWHVAPSPRDKTDSPKLNIDVQLGNSESSQVFQISSPQRTTTLPWGGGWSNLCSRPLSSWEISWRQRNHQPPPTFFIVFRSSTNKKNILDLPGHNKWNRFPTGSIFLVDESAGINTHTHIYIASHLKHRK